MLIRLNFGRQEEKKKNTDETNSEVMSAAAERGGGCGLTQTIRDVAVSPGDALKDSLSLGQRSGCLLPPLGGSQREISSTASGACTSREPVSISEQRTGMRGIKRGN